MQLDAYNILILLVIVIILTLAGYIVAQNAIYANALISFDGTTMLVQVFNGRPSLLSRSTVEISSEEGKLYFIEKDGYERMLGRTFYSSAYMIFADIRGNIIDIAKVKENNVIHLNKNYRKELKYPAYIIELHQDFVKKHHLTLKSHLTVKPQSRFYPLTSYLKSVIFRK